MHFSKSLQGSKSAITMLPVSIESTSLLFLLIENFLVQRRSSPKTDLKANFLDPTK